MEPQNDPRPRVYRYWDQLTEHLGGDRSRFFDGRLVYPRQFEIHLPADHRKPCNLACPHCAGKLFERALGNWEIKALALLEKLAGKIPFHIYGGAYTEPLMNPYYMAFLAMTKRHGNHFGIHTNGVLLNWLENEQGWLTELNRISTDGVDYLSIAIDAGTAWNWAKTKGTRRQEYFHEIILGVEKAVRIRKARGAGHAIRLCYLISPESGNREDFTSIVAIARSLGVDSLRFSIPFALYNQTFDRVRGYKAEVEVPGDDKYRRLLDGLLSHSQDEVPYIFYTGPEFTDIEKFDFRRCIYGYYQITFGADGGVYKCSTTATPTMQMCRLGDVTDDLDVFNEMVLLNQSPRWDCETCFRAGARCNRMGLEINRIFAHGRL